MTEALEPLRITQIHAALDGHGTWEVTVRSQRSRVTLHGQADPIPAIYDAANRVLSGQDDDADDIEPGPVRA